MACGEPTFERLQTRWIDRSALSKAYQLHAGEKFVFADDKIYIQDSGGNYIGTVDSRDCIVSEQRPINDILAAFAKETAPRATPTFKVGDEVEWDEIMIGGICASTIVEVNEFNAMLTGNGWTNWQMPVSRLRHRAKPKQKQFKVGDVVIWQADNGRAHCGEIVGINPETTNIKACARILVVGPDGCLSTFMESLDKLEHNPNDEFDSAEQKPDPPSPALMAAAMRNRDLFIPQQGDSHPSMVRCDKYASPLFQFPSRQTTLDFFRALIPHMDGLAAMLKSEKVEPVEFEKRMDEEWEKQMKKLGEKSTLRQPVPSFNADVAKELIEHANMVMGRRLDETITDCKPPQIPSGSSARSR